MLYGQSPEGFELKPKHERLLRKLTIDDDGPGTVLDNFDAFLTYIKQREMSVTPMHQLRRRMLPEINALLTRPIQMGLSKPLQKSYPHIHGLYLLVRASGLTSVEGTAKKPLLTVDDALYRSWQGLNAAERYCTLLETWLLRGRPEIIGEREYGRSRIPDTFGKLPWFFQSVPDEGLTVGGDKETEDSLRYYPGWHNLGLLELFGMIAIQPVPLEPGQGWHVGRIERTALGDALLTVLHARFFGDINNIRAIELKDKIPFGVLQPTLQPYFPEWQHNLSVPEWSFREGAHVFKVTLWDSLWRRIAVPADDALDELASAILDAVEFDHNHLYAFNYRNRFGVTERINHPFLDEGPWTSEVPVGETPLKVGQAMTFVCYYSGIAD